MLQTITIMKCQLITSSPLLKNCIVPLSLQNSKLLGGCCAPESPWIEVGFFRVQQSSCFTCIFQSFAPKFFCGPAESFFPCPLCIISLYEVPKPLFLYLSGGHWWHPLLCSYSFWFAPTINHLNLVFVQEWFCSWTVRSWGQNPSHSFLHTQALSGMWCILINSAVQNPSIKKQR